MSPTLPFDKWSETEGKSFSGLDELREYGNYYRAQSFAENGRTTEDTREVDNQLVNLAARRGYLEVTEDGNIDTQDYYAPKRSLDADIQAVHTFYRDSGEGDKADQLSKYACLLYTSPSPRDRQKSRMPSSA